LSYSVAFVNNKIYNPILNGICNVVSFATADVYLQHMNIKKIQKITKNALGKHVYSKQEYIFQLLFIIQTVSSPTIHRLMCKDTNINCSQHSGQCHAGQ